MTDEELRGWWPELGTLVVALRRMGQTAVADLLVGAVRGGTTSGEILDGLGGVLRDHGALRPHLSDSALTAWKAVMADVHRAYPGSWFAHRFSRLIRVRGRRGRG
jgi:hypothetical protein